MKRNRKRSKMTRYNPDPVKALRAEMAKHPNPMFGQMLVQERMSDGDLLDFSVSVAISYFNGALLEPVAAAAGRELERMARQTLLVTAAKFGATATFTKDGGAVLKSVFPDDGPDLLTFGSSTARGRRHVCRGSDAGIGATGPGTMPHGVRHTHSVTRGC